MRVFFSFVFLFFLCSLCRVNAQLTQQCTVNVSSTLAFLTSGLAQIPTLASRECRPDEFLDLNGNKTYAQVQSVSIAANTWTTIFSAPPGSSGAITNLWAAINDASSSQSTLNSAWRITFNQASVPQFGGVNGIGWTFLFGRMQATLTGQTTPGSSGTPIMRSNTIGSHYLSGPYCSPAGTCHSGYFRFLMPFTNGFKVEYNSGVTDVATTLWAQVEWTSATAVPVCNVNWVLNAVSNPSSRNFTAITPCPAGYIQDGPDTRGMYFCSNAIPNIQEQNLFGWTAVPGSQVRLSFLGGHHTVRSGPVVGSPVQGFLEGDYKVYTDSSTPSFQSSGTEDYYMSDYYFSDELVVARDYWGYISQGPFSAGAYGYEFLMAYRFFRYNEMPLAVNSFNWTWTNGDAPGHGAGTSSGQTVSSVWSAFYYTSNI